jgi:hypothetical protein
LGNGKLISDAALSDIGKPMGKSAVSETFSFEARIIMAKLS